MSRDGGKGWEEFRPGGFPAVAVRDIAVATQGDDLVLATHGRGIWIIDDISPLRALTPEVAASDVTLIPSDTVRQLIRGNGGWPEGDAVFIGENSVDGAVITYYQKARHVIGRMKLEILDSNGKVVDTLPTSKRKGLNRVVWSMRTKPPQVPPAAIARVRLDTGPARHAGDLHRPPDQGRQGHRNAAGRRARQEGALHGCRPPGAI